MVCFSKPNDVDIQRDGKPGETVLWASGYLHIWEVCPTDEQTSYPWKNRYLEGKYSIVPIMSCVKCFPFRWQGSGGHKVCSRQILWGVWEPTQRWEDGSVMGWQEGDPEACSFPAVCGPWLDFDFPVELFGIFLGTIWSKLSAALGASRRGLGQDAGLSNPPDTLLQLNRALKRPWWGEGHGVP